MSRTPCISLSPNPPRYLYSTVGGATLKIYDKYARDTPRYLHSTVGGAMLGENSATYNVCSASYFKKPTLTLDHVII